MALLLLLLLLRLLLVLRQHLVTHVLRYKVDDLLVVAEGGDCAEVVEFLDGGVILEFGSCDRAHTRKKALLFNKWSELTVDTKSQLMRKKQEFPI